MAEEIAVPEILDYIEKNAQRFGVDAKTAKRLFLAENMESSGKLPPAIESGKISPAGATGLMQVLPATYNGLKKNKLLPADHSMDSWTGEVEAGLAALRDMQNSYKTNDPNVLAAAYQGGTRAVKLALAGDYKNLPPMAQDYQKRMTIADSILGPANPSQRDVRLSEVGAPIVAAAVGNTSGLGTSTVARATGAFADVFANTKSIMEGLIGEITSSATAEAKARKDQVVEIQNEGNAAAAQAAAEASIKGMASTTRERILKILNLDDRDATNRISENLARLEVLDAARMPLKAEIDARQSVGFFDNPLQYLANRTILPAKINQYNALARDANEAAERIDVLQRMGQLQETIAVGATADQYASAGVATSNLAVAKANAEAAKATAESASATARKVMGIAHLQAQLGGAALTSMQLESVAAAKDEKIAKDRDLQADVKRVDGRVKLIGEFIGSPNIGFQQWKEMPAKDQQEWNIRMSTGRLGDTLSESVPFILRYGDVRTMAATGSAEIAEVVKKMQVAAEASATVLQSSGMAAGEKKPKGHYMVAAYDVVQNQIEQERTLNMLKASDTNPYKASHQAIANSWKGNPDNPVYKTASDAVKNRLKVNDTVLFDSVTKQIDAGLLTPAQAAAAFTEYYGEVAKRNNSGRGLEMLGLPKQTDYIVLPKDSQLRLNYLNRVELENFFLQRVTNKEQLQDVYRTIGKFG